MELSVSLCNNKGLNVYYRLINQFPPGSVLPHGEKYLVSFCQATLVILSILIIPGTEKYWDGIQQSQFYLMVRRYTISLGWLPSLLIVSL